MTKKSLFAMLVASLAFASFSPSAQAWDKVVEGRIGLIEVGTNGASYFTLEGLPALCNSASEARYGLVYAPPTTDRHATAEGSKVFISVLTAAKLSAKRVRVFADNNPSGGWGCVVGAVEVL